MTFMESLIGTHFIRYVGTNMQHIIKETIHLAGTSADWRGIQLPEAVYEGAQQMLLTLSNIHTLNNIENFANTQSDEVTGDVADFLAGVSVVNFVEAITFAAQRHSAVAWQVHWQIWLKQYQKVLDGPVNQSIDIFNVLGGNWDQTDKFSSVKSYSQHLLPTSCVVRRAVTWLHNCFHPCLGLRCTTVRPQDHITLQSPAHSFVFDTRSHARCQHLPQIRCMA